MSEQRPANPADDDAYRALFRPDDAPPAPAAASDHAAAPAPEPSPAAAAEPSASVVDTGRLFRSSRAASAAAVPAVTADQASRLRTLASADAPAAVRISSGEPRPAAPLVSDPVGGASAGEAPEMPRSRRQSGLTPLGAYAITIGATVAAGVLDILIGGAGLGVTTGVVLLIASVFTALRVRIADAAVAVIAPPIAFFVAAITVGQIGQSSTGGFIGRVVNTFFMLAGNWLWIIGATLIALVIVFVRSRRAD